MEVAAVLWEAEKGSLAEFLAMGERHWGSRSRGVGCVCEVGLEGRGGGSTQCQKLECSSGLGIVI